MHGNLRLPVDLPQPAQSFAQNVAFRRRLALEWQVLILAASAAAEVRAQSLHALVRRLQNPQGPRVHHTFSGANFLYLGALAGQHARRQHGASRVVAERLAAVDQFDR